MAVCGARSGAGSSPPARCWVDAVLLAAVLAAALHSPGPAPAAAAAANNADTACALYSLSRSVEAVRARVSLAMEAVPHSGLPDLPAAHSLRRTFERTRRDVGALTAGLGGAAGSKGRSANPRAAGGRGRAAARGAGGRGLCAAVWVDADGVEHACARRASFAHCLGGISEEPRMGAGEARSPEATDGAPSPGLYCKAHRPAAFRSATPTREARTHPHALVCSMHGVCVTPPPCPDPPCRLSNPLAPPLSATKET